MLAGPIGDALDYSPIVRWIVNTLVKHYARELETGFSGQVNLEPENSTYLTRGERLTLHLMRVACCLFAERLDVFPWRLRDRSTDELRPLLSRHYQGMRAHGTDSSGNSRYVFHGVWDVRPADRMNEAVFGFLLLAIFGDTPRTDRDMVVQLIQNMRNAGWAHVLGLWDDYDGYPTRSPDGPGTYAFEDVEEVKRGGCHITSNYIVARLRSLNIPAHMGRHWAASGLPTNQNEYRRLLHRPPGHCFVHFHTVGWWFSHGDDVYNALLKNIPPDFAMRSEHWMRTNHFDTSEYEWIRAAAFDDHFWWCFLIAPSNYNFYDVAWLFNSGMLRDRLENIHEDLNLAVRDGAPSNVPPVFDQSMVNFLMAWVDSKLS